MSITCQKTVDELFRAHGVEIAMIAVTNYVVREEFKNFGGDIKLASLRRNLCEAVLEYVTAANRERYQEAYDAAETGMTP